MEKFSLEDILKYNPHLIIIEEVLIVILSKLTIDEFLIELSKYPYIYDQVSNMTDFWENYYLKWNPDFIPDETTNWFYQSVTKSKYYYTGAENVLFPLLHPDKPCIECVHA